MKAGDLIYDEKGKQAPDYRELRDTYETYHVSDLNVAGSQPRTPPNGSPSAVNAERGLRRAVQGEGEGERLPTDDERTAMVVTDEVKKVIDDQRNIKGVTVAQDVGSITEARFRIKDGKATIEIPPAEKFSDIHRQASSVVQTCPHSQLYAAAATRIAVATEAGHKDPAAEDGVPACKAPLKSRDASEEYGRAELAATYATLNRVTQIPAVYVPPPSTQDAETQDKSTSGCWALFSIRLQLSSSLARPYFGLTALPSYTSVWRMLLGISLSGPAHVKRQPDGSSEPPRADWRGAHGGCRGRSGSVPCLVGHVPLVGSGTGRAADRDERSRPASGRADRRPRPY